VQATGSVQLPTMLLPVVAGGEADLEQEPPVAVVAEFVVERPVPAQRHDPATAGRAGRWKSPSRGNSLPAGRSRRFVASLPIVVQQGGR
jgi:hypothetical protein